MTKRTLAALVVPAALAVLTLCSGAAFAGQGQQGRMMGQRGRPTVDEQVARMKTNLNLSDKQAAQVKELFEKQAKGREAWMKDHPNATRTEMREHAEAMFKERNEGLKKILTKEQYKKHEEMMRQMRRGPKGPPQS